MSTGFHEFFASNTSWDSPFDGNLELYDEIPVFVDLPLGSAELVRHVRLQVEADDSEFPKVLYSLAELSLFE